MAVRSKYKRRERAPREWFGWIKSQPCLLNLVLLQLGATFAIGHRCEGPIEADHAGKREHGAFRKCADRDCIPLCQLGHRQRTDYSGVFRGFDADRMRAFCDKAIELTHGRAHAAGIEIPSC